MSTGGEVGVSANDVELRVDGRPPGGWLLHHGSEHPNTIGTYLEGCPFCRYDQRVREAHEAQVAANGAYVKVEKQRAFLADAEAALVDREAELRRAVDMSRAAEAEMQAELDRKD